MTKQVNLLTMDIKHKLVVGDNMTILPTLESGSAKLAIVDPPYNTRDKRSKNGNSYKDCLKSGDYIAWLETVIRQCHRVLTDDGSAFVFINQAEELNVWLMLRQVFGERNLINKIIWTWDWGKRSTKRWTKKYDTIFWFAKNKDNYVYNADESDRIAKRAPNLFGTGFEIKDKQPTDVWWQTIVTATHNESTGYPTQKPQKIIERIVRVHSDMNDVVLDCFAGSGTTGAACEQLCRNSILIERNPQAVEIMKQRLNYVNLEIYCADELI